MKTVKYHRRPLATAIKLRIFFFKSVYDFAVKSTQGGFSTYSHISCMRSPLVMWSKSNHIAVFAQDLKSAYEGKHGIFGLLSLADLAQNDVLQFHPFTWNDKISFFFMTE
jgi:hypothetical protein